MRIVFHTDKIYKKMGGSTISTLQTLEVLESFGHEVIVLAKKIEQIEGFRFPIFQTDKFNLIKEFYSWADVVFAMRETPLANIKKYNCWEVPHGAHPIYSVYFARNVGQPYKFGYSEGDVDLVVFNAKWVKKATGWRGDTFVLHPPILKENYLVKPGTFITQINLAKKKGGNFFWQIVKAMPDQQFIAVKGKEEKYQVIPESLPANVKILEYTSDIKSVYEQTKILLMPSQGYNSKKRWMNEKLWTESYGRVGVEAAVSGIIVIAYSTPGIKEALGSEGIYCDMNVDSWVHEIRKLNDKKVYEVVSNRFRAIGERLTTIKDIEKLEKLLLNNINSAKRIKRRKYRAFFNTPPHKRMTSDDLSKIIEATK
jgi:glycosyltransferase involved in cell wall biosynthesis